MLLQVIIYTASQLWVTSTLYPNTPVASASVRKVHSSIPHTTDNFYFLNRDVNKNFHIRLFDIF